VYGDDARNLLAVINGVEDQYHSIMLSGHNPSVTELANILDKEFSKDLPTGGLVGMTVDIHSWGELKAGDARTRLTLFPEKE
jgi:phosphohistidine phosphatase SixA